MYGRLNPFQRKGWVWPRALAVQTAAARTPFYKTRAVCLKLDGDALWKQRLNRTTGQLSTTDILAPATMKNAAKRDTWCELQNSANHRVFERTLRPRTRPQGTPASAPASIHRRLFSHL